MARSALLNVMVQAALKAGKSLSRDFGEVQNLQVSVKGPSDFVSQADLKAEKIVRDELLKARPTYGFLGEEARRSRERTAPIAGLLIRSTERRTSCTAFRNLPSRSPWSATARSSPASSSIQRRMSFTRRRRVVARS